MIDTKKHSHYFVNILSPNRVIKKYKVKRYGYKQL